MTAPVEHFPDGCYLLATSDGWRGVTPWGLRSRPRDRDGALKWLNTERYLQAKRLARAQEVAP